MASQLKVVIWTDAEAAPLPTVVLEDWSGASNTRATLEDNVIIGIVSLYGVPASGSQGPSQEEKRILDDPHMMREKLRTLAWGDSTTSLWMRGNRLSRMTIGAGMREKVKKWLLETGAVSFSGALHTLFMNENFVEFSDNFWLAQNLRMTTNSFDPVNEDVGWAITKTAFYVANSASNDFRLFNAAHRPQNNPGALNFLINIVFV